MTTTVRQAVGSLLVVGLTAKELSEMERAWLKLMRPAGIILYKRNITDAAQTRAMIAEASSFCLPHWTSFVDVEGGLVNRLREALAPIPSAQAAAQAALKSGDMALARQHGELVARAVKAFGFNTSLAPMIDLALPDSVEVLGTRCPAPDAAGVVAYARAFLAGLKAQGVVGCIKHFPGLGGGTRDSHLETPAIRRPWARLWQEDLEPYRALRNVAPMVMINHAAYPETADKKQPASVSNFWIRDVLRKRIGYKGIILSDDLEMGGVVKFMPIEEAGIAAVRVGSDLVEICHHPEPILRVFEALVSEGERSSAFRKILFERSRISEKKRKKTFPAKMPPALSATQLEALRGEVLRYGEMVEKIIPAASIAGPVRPATSVETA